MANKRKIKRKLEVIITVQKNGEEQLNFRDV